MLGTAVVLLLVGLACLCTGGVPRAEAESQPDHYCVDPSWPRFPDGFALGRVAGVAISPGGLVYVFHRGHRIRNEDQSFLGRAWASLKWRLNISETPSPIVQDTIIGIDPRTGSIVSSFGANRYLFPHGLTIDSAGNLWVTDIMLHQVFKLTPKGKVLLALGEKGVAGDDRRHFNGPTDVAIASDGSFYVSDGYGNARVVKFSADGKFVMQWGSPGTGPGQFRLPHSIAIDKDDNLYVADRSNARVQVFDRNGKFLRQIAGPRIGRPWAVDIGPDGDLYVADGGDMDKDHPRSGLVKLSPTGTVLSRWSEYGYGPGQLVWPHDLAVSKTADVYVGEILDSKRVQKFTPHCAVGV